MRGVLPALTVALSVGAPAIAGASLPGGVQGVVREGAAQTLLPGVRVVAVPEEKAPGTVLSQVTTAADGSFKFPKLAPGRYEIVFHIDALGFEQSRPGVEVTESHVAFVEERLDLAKVAGVLSGEVTGATGEPAAGANVSASLQGPAGQRISRNVQADEQGHFRIGGLPPGSYAVRVYAGGASASSAAQVEAGGEARADLRLDEPAVAHSTDGVLGEQVAISGGSARSMAASWLVLPESGLELGTTLSFLSAPAADGGQPLPGMAASRIRFTDVVLFGLSGRYSLNGKVELHGGATLLPKQPVGAGELVWQGAQGGGRLAVGKHFAADLDVGGGPLLDDQGTFGTALAAFRGKTTVDEWRSITFEGALGGDFTNLFWDGSGNGWFSEALAQANVLLHTPGGEFGGWVGFDLRFPLAHGTASMAPALDPQTRANFRVGTVYSVAHDWDLWVEYAVLDRGDVSDPSTTLPILDGGFDQRQLVFGVVRRFDLGEHGPTALIAVPME